MSIREVIEMLKTIFEILMEYLGPLFEDLKGEDKEEGGEAEA